MRKHKVRETSMEPLQFGQEVTLSGIEKYENSDVVGELVCPNIVLWDKISRRRKPVAVAQHSEKAKLVDMKRNSRHIMYYKLEVATDDGPVQGWVMFPFVDEAVKETYGQADI